MALRDRDPAYMQLLKERQAARIAAQPTVQSDAPMAKIDSLESELGVPVNKKNLADYALGAFSEADLAAAGMSGEALKKFGETIKQKEEAKTGVLGGLKYMPGLSVYEDALKTKGGVGQFKPGGSELYASLGIKGFGALTADLAQKAAEQEQKYNSFSQALSSVATGQNVEFQSALNSYKLLNDEYNTTYKRIDDILAEQRAIENELTLRKGIADMERKLAQEKGEGIFNVGGTTYTYNSSTGKYEPFTPASDLKRGDLVPGYGTITVDGGASGSWKYGLDLFQPYGTPVKAKTGGKVIKAGRNGNYGNQVVVELDDGTKVMYNHMGNLYVQEGQTIREGDQVGTYGNTGYVTNMDNVPYTEQQKSLPSHPGTHLDVTMQGKDGKYYSPKGVYDYLLSGNTKGVLTGGVNQKLIDSTRKIGTYAAYNLDEEVKALEAEDPAFASQVLAAASGDYSNILPPDQVRFTDLVYGLTKGDSKIKTKETANIAVALMNGEIDRAKTLAYRKLTGDLDATVNTQLRTGLSVLEDLTYLRGLYDQLEKTGVVAGTIEDLYNKLGTSSMPNAKAAQQEVDRLIQAYTKGQTGAQFSAAEMVRYQQLFPTLKKTKALNLLTIDALMNQVGQDVNSIVTNESGFSFDNVFDLIPAYEHENFLKYSKDKERFPLLLGGYEESSQDSELFTNDPEVKALREQISKISQEATALQQSMVNTLSQ